MKYLKTGLSLAFTMFLIAVVVPCQVLAQGIPPPPCCDEDSLSGSTVVVPEIQNQVVMSDSALLAMGISRSQFLDRLAAALFPGQEISVIYAVTTTISVPPDPSSVDKSPELVQITYQYRVPRSQMKTEEIDALTQLVITDGVTYIQIKSTPAQAVTTVR